MAADRFPRITRYDVPWSRLQYSILVAFQDHGVQTELEEFMNKAADN